MSKILPMLAHDFKKRGHDIKWPAYVQPKLNGVRCLTHKIDKNNIQYKSRTDKSFVTLGHLTPFLLEKMQVGDILDGELFSEDLSFEEIISAIKRVSTQNPDVLKLGYWVYDCINDRPYKERLKMAQILAGENRLWGISGGQLEYVSQINGPGLIRSVPTYEVTNKEGLEKCHSQFVKDGYEGTMVRNINGLYAVDKRSVDLQKYKDFIDEEFLIIGGRSGIGKETGCVVFICETEDGKKFECRPRGSYEKRKVWLKKLYSIVGKKLTVRYQNRSGGNMPIFPVGIEIRDYE